jgi:hypothetical protein
MLWLLALRVIRTVFMVWAAAENDGVVHIVIINTMMQEDASHFICLFNDNI